MSKAKVSTASIGFRDYSDHVASDAGMQASNEMSFQNWRLNDIGVKIREKSRLQIIISTGTLSKARISTASIGFIEDCDHVASDAAMQAFNEMSF